MSRITEKGATGVLEIFETSTDPALATLVGSRYDTADGRSFVLVQNGGSALAAGKLVQSVPNTAAHIGLAVTAFTAYSANGNIPATVTCTLATTGVLQNEYAGGYALIASGTGAGQYLKIASNTALTAGSGTATFTFENPDGQTMTALVAASSTVSLFRNPYGSANGGTASTSTVNNSTNGVVICPTTVTGTILGASTYAIAASTSTVPSYGLIQVSGTAALLNRANTTIGLNIGQSSSTTAGAFETYVVATNTMVGYASQAGTDGQYSQVVLTLG